MRRGASAKVVIIILVVISLMSADLDGPSMLSLSLDEEREARAN
jgi:hypothetical protein